MTNELKVGESTDGPDLKAGQTILAGEAVDYLIQEFVFGNESEGEVIKLKRQLDSDYQSLSLNNADMQAALSGFAQDPPTSRIVRSGDAIQIQCLINGKWVWRFRAQMEARGRMWESNKSPKSGVSHPTPSYDPVENDNSKPKPTEENLLMAFLQGQQTLLEKLIDQTT